MTRSASCWPPSTGWPTSSPPADLAGTGTRRSERGGEGTTRPRCASVCAVTLPDRLADQPTSDGPPPPRPGGRWRTPLRLVVAVVSWPSSPSSWPVSGNRPSLGRLSVPVVLASWAMVLAGIYATFRSWRAALTDLGATLPHTGAMRVFYLGQLGKYVPGTIWPLVTQMRLGRDYRVPPRPRARLSGCSCSC